MRRGGHAVFRLLLLLALAVSAHAAAGEIVEEVHRVPVRVSNVYGKEVAQDVVVTVFRDADAAKAPYLLLNHGRASTPSARAALGRARYQGNSAYFASKGLVVIVPTRVGYGVTGGEDVEHSGGCSSSDYGKVFKTAADLTAQVLEHFSRMPYVDTSRGIVVGQSYGGTTAAALSTYDLPGLKGAFNFAGGGGGDAQSRPGYPCRADLLKELFADYGKNGRVPVFWFYSVNDKFWGEDLPKEWFEAFRNAGGRGQFFSLPPYQNDGHASFTGNPAGWKPLFEQALVTLGLQ